MTNRHTKNARVLRRIGAAVAATIVVSTAAASGSQASTTPSTPKAGGDIKVAIFDTFPGFCVANNPANSSLMATRTMFEGLVEKTRGGDFIGLLAKSWTKSTDLKTWTFQIREGIKFHDGSDLTADVVVANYNYSSGRAFASVAARSGAAAARTAVMPRRLGERYETILESMDIQVARLPVQSGADRPCHLPRLRSTSVRF